jgi:hypothetical protein
MSFHFFGPDRPDAAQTQCRSPSPSTPCAVQQLNSSLWDLTEGPIYGTSGAAVHLLPSEKDRLYKLPVNYVLSEI